MGKKSKNAGKILLTKVELEITDSLERYPKKSKAKFKKKVHKASKIIASSISKKSLSSIGKKTKKKKEKEK